MSTHRRPPLSFFFSLLAVFALGCAGGSSSGPDVVPDVPGGAGTDASDIAAEVAAPPRAVAYTEARAPCADYDPSRTVFFGDLHAHTGLSWDAWAYEVRATPASAYRFARGDTVALAPLDEHDHGTREARLARPLDFVALSDHLEYVAEVQLCTTPGSPAFETAACERFRAGGEEAVVAWGFLLSMPGPLRMSDLCGPDGAWCRDAFAQGWGAVRDAAEEAYDRSAACDFVSFVAYEYTASTYVTNRHRNVIFRTGEVPDFPPSYYEANTPAALRTLLDETCHDAGAGCDYLVIPHNANWSNGNLYTPEYRDAGLSLEEQRGVAETLARAEPLVEIFQHKGDMECKNGFSRVIDPPDPFCDFEKIRGALGDPDSGSSTTVADCGDRPGSGGVQMMGCVSWLDFVRNVWKEGLLEWERVGVNPFKIGVVGATDTHNGTPGHTAEHDFPGHVGTVDDSPEKRLGHGTMTHDAVLYNPGGLTAVWAEERSRDALFAAFQRRETYATSGTRLRVRLFGGWDLPEDLCERDDRVAAGYAAGVPMGGDLPTRPEGAALTLAVWAHPEDGGPERPATPLARLQLIKGWIDAEGRPRERVVDLRVREDEGGGVDLATCARPTPPDDAAELCAVWTDPEPPTDRPAFYYVRVLEQPTCRWSTWDCLALAEMGERPAACDDPQVPKTVQERAWTSPIWYEPPPTE